MNTPSKLTPDDRGTFELLLQMGYTAQDALQQMTQPPVATPSEMETWKHQTQLRQQPLRVQFHQWSKKEVNVLPLAQ